jgi:outer membrane lipoprotein carrier protein
MISAWRVARILLAIAVPSFGGVADAETGFEAAEAASADDCAPVVAERVQRRYDAVQDLRARFVQRTVSVAFGSADAAAMEARGEVLFAKPGRMRWSYEAPEPSLVVSDGAVLWIYDPRAQEVQQFPVGPEFLSGAAIQFLLGEGRLVDEFEIEARDCDETRVWLLLTPRKDSSYERLELAADRETGEIRSTVVVDILGNRTEVILQDVQSNTKPAAERFEFEPPPGTRVLAVPNAR